MHQPLEFVVLEYRHVAHRVDDPLDVAEAVVSEVGDGFVGRTRCDRLLNEIARERVVGVRGQIAVEVCVSLLNRPVAGS